MSGRSDANGRALSTRGGRALDTVPKHRLVDSYLAKRSADRAKTPVRPLAERMLIRISMANQAEIFA
jgi:hypothetical protein